MKSPERIREEFEKACEEVTGYEISDNPYFWLALWGAKWSLQKVADLWERGEFKTEVLVKMLKELDQ